MPVCLSCSVRGFDSRRQLNASWTFDRSHFQTLDIVRAKDHGFNSLIKFTSPNLNLHQVTNTVTESIGKKIAKDV